MIRKFFGWVLFIIAAPSALFNAVGVINPDFKIDGTKAFESRTSALARLALSLFWVWLAAYMLRWV